MAMTGKYAAGGDTVTVTATVENDLRARIKTPATGAAYTGSDVEFHCCSNGIVICIPVSGWVKKRTHMILGFNSVVLQHGNDLMKDLKVIYDARAKTGVKFQELQTTLQTACNEPE